MRITMISMAAITGLSACADPKPISVERAMAQCTQKARSATKPDVSVGVGVGTGGKVSGGIGIGLSGDYMRGTPPEEVYETCVIAKSGEKPTQPLTL
jgi:hypothetical protein